LRGCLERAIQFAGDKNVAVFVLSIPDWGVTSFADGRDRKKNSAEIDSFNTVCEFIATKHNCNFLDITSSQRNDGCNGDFLAPDKLHPSGKEYSKWALLLSDKILAAINQL
jgi:hypothetical protein